MARSRKDAWLRDELILALDLYKREGRNPSAAAVKELSDLLRSIPIERELAADARFRNEAGVYLKVYNFVSIDPTAETTGMTRGGRGDLAAWEEFADDPVRLAAAADAIRANLDAVKSSEIVAEDEILSEAPEGTLLTTVHVRRERSGKLVASKKAAVLAEEGKLTCEGCGFEFASVYGERGEGFIECHHTKPVHTLKPGERTKLVDLALVCSNCHRMIHRRSPWLTMQELCAIVAERSVFF